MIRDLQGPAQHRILHHEPVCTYVCTHCVYICVYTLYLFLSNTAAVEAAGDSEVHRASFGMIALVH